MNIIRKFLNLFTADSTCKCKMETFHKTLEFYAALAKSPTNGGRTQGDYCSMPLSLYMACCLEGLMGQNRLNHFAL